MSLVSRVPIITICGILDCRLAFKIYDSVVSIQDIRMRQMHQLHVVAVKLERSGGVGVE